MAIPTPTTGHFAYAAGARPEEQPVNNLTPIEILLVEDSHSDAEMTLRALKRHHLTNGIEWFEDGATAIDYLLRRGSYASRSSGDPRLILLDLKMPKLDGIDVLRVLKADAATRTIPVVMLTSSNEESDIVRSYDLGVNSYIVKPVEFTKFVEEVSKLGIYWIAMNKIPSPAKTCSDN
jgi:two-component system response regulator